ncbi:MAG TPA: hypothetical protein VIG66_10910 [Noviherbaspirillum sp.]
MNLPRNQFGVPQFPPHDARRLFVLLSAIELLERPTAAAIADLTGHERETVDQDVIRLREEFGVEVARVGEVYHINSWGNILNKSGVQQVLKS